MRSALEQIESTEFTFFNGHYDTWCYLPIVATVTFNDETAQFAVASWSSTSWRKLEPGSCTAIHISPGKVVSLFEPHTEIIRKGKLAKPTEFGRVVKIQEAEAQFIADYAAAVLELGVRRLSSSADYFDAVADSASATLPTRWSIHWK